jgi:hypothetical protein
MDKIIELAAKICVGIAPPPRLLKSAKAQLRKAYVTASFIVFFEYAARARQSAVTTACYVLRRRCGHS